MLMGGHSSEQTSVCLDCVHLSVTSKAPYINNTAKGSFCTELTWS